MQIYSAEFLNNLMKLTVICENCGLIKQIGHRAFKNTSGGWKWKCLKCIMKSQGPKISSRMKGKYPNLSIEQREQIRLKLKAHYTILGNRLIIGIKVNNAINKKRLKNELNK